MTGTTANAIEAILVRQRAIIAERPQEREAERHRANTETFGRGAGIESGD